MALIELADVRKIYQLGEVEVSALAGVTLDIEAGEYLSLIGPSGSGKSTLMNTLGCLDRPTGGSYKLAGEEVVTMSADSRARLRNDRIGFVFQNFNLLNRTSALENVELPLMYSKQVSVRERRERAKDLLELVGLADRMGHHPSQLSGGQQQRVAIARALVNRPSIIMADEPTGNLDTRTSGDIIDLFRKLNADQITIILVTHDQDVARNADRTIMLRDGLVVTDSRNSPHPVSSTQSARSDEECEQSGDD
ncbi:MAG: ABC transporter ATP-binding protein [Planctomycetaceae bacterium]|nr:ABC transporter ATP-binding protein [Planctomycetaceae bacterium]